MGACEAEPRVSNWGAQGLANSLGACEAEPRMGDWSARSLINTAWAFTRQSRSWSIWNAQGLANTAWAFAGVSAEHHSDLDKEKNGEAEASNLRAKGETLNWTVNQETSSLEATGELFYSSSLVAGARQQNYPMVAL